MIKKILKGLLFRFFIGGLAISQAAYAEKNEDEKLQKVIIHALEENITWQDVKLSNKAQSESAQDAHHQFDPRFFLQSTYVKEQERFLNQSYHSHRFDVGPTLQWRFPLGTKLEARLQYETGTENPRQHYAISIKQPLLKGFGAVNTLDVKMKKIEQQQSFLELNAAAMRLVTDVCKRYFQIQLTAQSVRIAKSNHLRAIELNQHIEQRISTGRIPAMDKQLIDSNQKQKEALYLESEQALMQANLALSYVLGGDAIPEEAVVQPDVGINFKDLKEDILFPLTLGIEDWLPYKIWLKKKERLALQRIVIEDKAKVDLNLFVSANSNRLSSEPDWPYRHTYQAGVEVSKPLTQSYEDKQQSQAYHYAKRHLELAKKDLNLQFVQQKQLLESNFKSLRQQKILMLDAEYLSRQNLEAAEYKLDAGRISLQEFLSLQYQQERMLAERQRLEMAFYELAIEIHIFQNTLLQRFNIQLDDKA